MSTILAAPPHAPIGTRPQLRVLPQVKPIPPLQSGDAMDAAEFVKRYKAMPEGVKAELIDGVVYLMLAFVRAEFHGDPDFSMQGWLYNYACATPGTKGSSNATAKMSPKDMPQPDISLRLLPEFGGKSYLDSDGCICGTPELVVEISGSSVSIDAHRKRDAYLRAGVPEYINWRTEERVLNWWHLKDGIYQLLAADNDGIIKSHVFPGLWLDVKAMIVGNEAKVLKVLRRGLKSKEHGAFVKRK